MKSDATTVEGYIQDLPQERKKAISQLRQTIKDHLPAGFEEVMSYGMIGYVVPHSLYPDGYHCNPVLPLPFINIASQKNFIALYHMGVYANKELYNWFVSEYPKHVTTKLDMGKSCIRFKKIETIPYELLGELCSRMTTKDWIDLYERNIKTTK
jgi:uncharacterized protein YdhG (YjbR/CyaY superfamily)